MIRQIGITAIAISVYLLLTASSCKRTTEQPSAGCERVMCTMMYAYVPSWVVDTAGAPVIFDEVYTLRHGNGERISLEQPQLPGGYMVLDDSYLRKLQNSKDSFTFVGIRQGKALVQEGYWLSADCCHVKKDKGRDTIIVR